MEFFKKRIEKTEFIKKEQKKLNLPKVKTDLGKIWNGKFIPLHYVFIYILPLLLYVSAQLACTIEHTNCITADG